MYYYYIFYCGFSHIFVLKKYAHRDLIICLRHSVEHYNGLSKRIIRIQCKLEYNYFNVLYNI